MSEARVSQVQADRPGIVVFPPLLYIVTLAAGLLLHFFAFNRAVLDPIPARILGGILVVAGAVIAKWGEAAMSRAGTNVDPRMPSLSITAEGPFRFTRNPLYLGLIAIYAGISLLFNAAAPLFLLPLVLIVMHYGVILREERYLERKFGRGYLDYKTAVRRYL